MKPTSIGLGSVGSTGSVGESTLDVVARHPTKFRVVALGAQRSAARLAEQALRFRPDVVALAETDAARELGATLARAGVAIRVVTGDDAMLELATLLAVSALD